jgi:(p)ppGpp synthase/HD superfamily hydrolase
MDLIEKSLEIALKAYRGQTDKAGETYILHPLRLMAKMDTKEEMAVALLHDVVEDSEYTAQKLANEGIPEDVVKAVEYLTKQDGESYEDFTKRVLENNLAAKIKKADIEDNLNVLRLKELSEKDLQRIAKYHNAWHSINEVLN